jgi:hypothetical protein
MKYIELLRARLAALTVQRDARLTELDVLADLLTSEARAAQPEEDTAAQAAEADVRAVQLTIAETQASLVAGTIRMTSISAPHPAPQRSNASWLTGR